LGSGSQVMDEVDGSAAAGDFQRGDVEMIAQGVELGTVNFAEVGALGVTSADQSVELFDAPFVTGAVGPGKEHAAGPVQRGGHRVAALEAGGGKPALLRIGRWQSVGSSCVR